MRLHFQLVEHLERLLGFLLISDWYLAKPLHRLGWGLPGGDRTKQSRIIPLIDIEVALRIQLICSYRLSLEPIVVDYSSLASIFDEIVWRMLSMDCLGAERIRALAIDDKPLRSPHKTTLDSQHLPLIRHGQLKLHLSKLMILNVLLRLLLLLMIKGSMT